jgi:hypothetical protein
MTTDRNRALAARRIGTTERVLRVRPLFDHMAALERRTRRERIAWRAAQVAAVVCTAAVVALNAGGIL